MKFTPSSPSPSRSRGSGSERRSGCKLLRPPDIGAAGVDASAIISSHPDGSRGRSPCRSRRQVPSSRWRSGGFGFRPDRPLTPDIGVFTMKRKIHFLTRRARPPRAHAAPLPRDFRTSASPPAGRRAPGAFGCSSGALHVCASCDGSAWPGRGPVSNDPPPASALRLFRCSPGSVDFAVTSRRRCARCRHAGLQCCASFRLDSNVSPQAAHCGSCPLSRRVRRSRSFLRWYRARCFCRSRSRSLSCRHLHSDRHVSQ